MPGVDVVGGGVASQAPPLAVEQSVFLVQAELVPNNSDVEQGNNVTITSTRSALVEAEAVDESEPNDPNFWDIFKLKSVRIALLVPLVLLVLAIGLSVPYLALGLGIGLGLRIALLVLLVLAIGLAVSLALGLRNNGRQAATATTILLLLLLRSSNEKMKMTISGLPGDKFEYLTTTRQEASSSVNIDMFC
jgi:hypothetical protein